MLAAGGLFAVVLALCYGVALRSWDGLVFVYLGEERAPAAVRTLEDYAAVQGEAPWASTERQVLGFAEVQKRDGYVGLSFGNPLVKMSDGGAAFACKVRGHSGLYDKVEMTFTGVGVSANGESAKLVIEALCQAVNDPGKIDTVWIPMSEIVAQPARDGEHFYGETLPETIYVKASDIPGEWPQSWTLTNFRLLVGSNGALSFDPAKLRSAREELLSFDF
jgi:hypothetical protein